MAASAQDFIRALRAPADPPHSGGPEKVQIAREVWNNPVLYVPNKGEAIAEFLLARLLKDKDKLPDVNPILDVRYWSLLRDVLVDSDVAKSRSAKAWLVPILQRTPFAPVANAVLASWIHRSANVPAQVSLTAQCLSILWPLAVAKFSPETLLECFGTVLHLLREYSIFRKALEPSVLPRVEHLLTQIIGSYRYSIANTSNKKKIFSAFSASHLQAWVECIDLQNGPSTPSVYSDVYEAGAETMFNVDALRQTQDRDDSPYLEPLSRVVASSVVAACHSLPRVFEAFMQVSRKHRAAIFGQSSHHAPGSSADQARLASLKFFTMCESLLRLVGDDELRWETRVKMLRIMDSEGLYGANNSSVDEVLRRVAEEAISVLANSIKENRQLLVGYILDTLSIITHIDYDLLSHSIPRVLPLLLLVPSFTSPAHTYLKHLLDYHTKTRTLDLLVEALLKACISQTLLEKSAASTCPILHHVFLDELAKSLKTFLTPGQVSGTIDTVLRYLRDQLEGLVSSAASGDDDVKPQKKKRKTEKGAATPANDESIQAAVAFSLTSHIASVVISSLPTRYLLEDTLGSVTEAVQDFYAFERSKLRDILKRIRREGSNHSVQWTASSISRLQYSIRIARSVQVSTQGDEKISSKLLSALDSPIIPELRVEVVRFLLSDVDFGYCESSPVFDEVLNLLEGRADESTWSGNIHDIQVNSQVTVATSHLMFNRWLPLFDAVSSEEQLARFAELMTSPQSLGRSGTSEKGKLVLSNVLRQALYNAELWELHRLRDAVLEQINDVTKPLDAVDVLKASHGEQKIVDVSPDTTGAYRLLLHIPTEYLSRGIRSDLLRRALAADLLLSDADAHARLYVREFLRRLFIFMGTVEHPAIGVYLAFLLQRSTQTTCSAAFVATSELIRMHLVVCVKSSLRGERSLLNDVLKTFTEFIGSNLDYESQELVWNGVMHLIDIVTSEAKPEGYDSAILGELKSLHQQLSTTILPSVVEASSRGSEVTANKVLLFSLWHRSLVFQRWLSSEASLPAFGKTIAMKLLFSQKSSDSLTSRLYLAALSIVQEECRSHLHTQQEEYLEVVLASYLAFCRDCDEKNRRELEELVSKFSKTLSNASFSTMLDLVHDGLSQPGLRLADIANLVHVLSLLLQNAPEGSSKVMQSLLTRCLQLFAAKQEYIHDGAVQGEVFHFIARQFNERPALVRQLDLSSVWSILGQSLECSAMHGSSTDKAAFHEIISTMSALIRLRRDLISSTLPHLAFALRRLLMSFRRLRPQLGAKQSKMVTDTLPRWISASDPLSAAEAKALARLLTTMTTKTVVRGQNATDTGKAESLARPFSKHAAYVLQAYIETLNDPLSVVPADVRKELEPGLFALCDMMGEYSRDALMVASLDAGGKTVLKNIWREYEKQKYVGKG